MPKSNNSIQRIVDRTFSDTASDLYNACVDCGEEPRIHVDDFLDMLCGSGEFGTWEEWGKVEDEVKAEVVRRCCPDKKGYISL